MYDLPFWESVRAKRLALPCCLDCGTVWYPPSPICPHCLSQRFEWRPVSGRGEILSWVVFHRQHFDDHPVPYNVVTVQLAEGPIFTTNLIGDVPQGSWIGHPVRLDYRSQDDGGTLPVVVLDR
jgi:uncharacterized OB-fold protein